MTSDCPVGQLCHLGSNSCKLQSCAIPSHLVTEPRKEELQVGSASLKFKCGNGNLTSGTNGGTRLKCVLVHHQPELYQENGQTIPTCQEGDSCGSQVVIMLILNSIFLCQAVKSSKTALLGRNAPMGNVSPSPVPRNSCPTDSSWYPLTFWLAPAPVWCAGRVTRCPGPKHWMWSALRLREATGPGPHPGMGRPSRFAVTAVSLIWIAPSESTVKMGFAKISSAKWTFQKTIKG